MFGTHNRDALNPSRGGYIFQSVIKRNTFVYVFYWSSRKLGLGLRKVIRIEIEEINLIYISKKEVYILR